MRFNPGNGPPGFPLNYPGVIRWQREMVFTMQVQYGLITSTDAGTGPERNQKGQP